MKKFFITASVATVIIFASCKKNNDKNSNNSGIQGTYKFMYITAKTNTTITDDEGEKDVAISSYTTTGNQGTFTFNNTNLTATGVGYTVDTLAYDYTYQDNILQDSSSYPFSYTYPPTSSANAYKLIGSDSIYFPGGSMAGGMVTEASGGKYVINGKLLTLTENEAKDSSFQDSGIHYHSVESVIASIIMEKQ